MAFEPKTFPEKQMMALCHALYLTYETNKYFLESLPPLSPDEPHRKHVERAEQMRKLHKANDLLHEYFLGD